MASRGSILSRRNLIKGMGAAALAPIPRTFAQASVKHWWLGNGMPQESASTPQIACAIDLHSGVTDEAIRSVVQLGVYHQHEISLHGSWTATGRLETKPRSGVGPPRS